MLPAIEQRPDFLRVVIPGKPFAQPRMGQTREGIRYLPTKARTWRKYAQDHILCEMDLSGWSAPVFPDGPLELVMIARFACPRSHYLKRSLRPAEWRDKLPDASNILKALEDAGNGLIWSDDRQIARLVIEQVTARQGESPETIIQVRQLEGAP